MSKATDNNPSVKKIDSDIAPLNTWIKVGDEMIKVVKHIAYI